MLRVSKLTDYATAIMACLAERPDEVLSAQMVAEFAHLEVPTVSKLLKQLAHAGLANSFRGASGGYRLARGSGHITVAEILVAIEGPIGMTECSAHTGLCHHESHCGVRVNWQRINQVIAQALESITLADMVRPLPKLRVRIPLRIAVG